MLAIDLCLLIFVGVITAEKQNNDIQGHVPSYVNVSTLIKKYPSAFNRPMPGQSSIITNDQSILTRHHSPFKNVITIKSQSSMNTTDQSSVSTTDQSSIDTVDQSSVRTIYQSPINTTDQSSVSTADKSSINTIDQSSVYTSDQSRTKMQSGSQDDCDGRCNRDTLTCAADGFTCICKEDYVDISSENSDTKDCRKIETTGCPRGWSKLEYPDKCLRVFSSTGINASDTSPVCSRHNSSAQLATLDSRGLEIFAGKLASDKGSFKTFRFGLSYNTSRKRWVWPSGYTLDLETSLGALNLKAINPNSEDMCAIIVTTNNISHWAATSCNNSLDGYVCEIDISPTGGYTEAIVIIVVASIFAIIVGGIPILACLYWIVMMIYECVRECFPPIKKSQSEFSREAHPSFVNQSRHQEDRNPTTAIANNVQDAVAPEKVGLPTNKFACEMSPPSDPKLIKMQDDLEDDSDEPPSYLEALHTRSTRLKL